MFCGQAPVFASPHRDHLLANPSVVEEMLFDGNPTLLGIHAGGRLTHTELNIEVCRTLVQYITLERGSMSSFQTFSVYRCRY
jgi:hypothetical protein